MAKFVCSVCGYTVEGDHAPERCPMCGVSADKFNKIDEAKGLTWATEHVIGVGKDVDAEVLQGLKDHHLMTVNVRATHQGTYPYIGYFPFMYSPQNLIKNLGMFNQICNSILNL